MKKYLGMLLMAVLMFASCEGVSESDASESGSISLSLSEEVSKTLEPEISMVPDSYILILEGPNGEYLESELDESESEASFEDLRYGTWTISANAYNSEGDLIGEASESCEVHSGETTEVTLVISEIAGEGVLSLEADWNGEDVETPVLSALLTDSEGTETVLDVTIDEESGIATFCSSLENGYYSLSFCLYDDDYLCTGVMEIVRIISDETTSASFDFTDLKVDGGTIDVNIDADLDDPLNPFISYDTDVAGVGEPIILSASLDEELDGVVYVWYVDGVSASTGDSYVFATDDDGSYRIDVAAFSYDGSRAGSTNQSVTISEEVELYMDIPEIQGAGHVSPYEDETVEKVLGVITATESYGFWMQSLYADDDDDTSEGIYVYDKYHSYEIGNLVSVSGEVQEYGYTDSLKLTELSDVTVTLLTSSYTLPDAVLIGSEGILPPSEYICNDGDPDGDGEGTVYDGEFDPEEDAIDWYEARESMLVEIDNPVAIGGTKYGEIPVIPEGVSYDNMTGRGGLVIYEDYFNPQRIHIDTDAYTLGLDSMEANLGDSFAESVQGVIGYSYGKFLVLPTSLPDIESNTVARETSGLSAQEDELNFATFNIENFPRDDEDMSDDEIEAKVEDIAETIVSGLNSPDIICLQEMTDDSYSDDDGTVTAENNAAMLIAAVEALNGPSYEYIDVEPEDNSDGGWTGANIRVGFLYNSATVDFTAVGDAGATDETEVVVEEEEVSLTLNPGRFSVDSFADSRKSVLVQFSFGGETIFVINNHFCSKSGDNYLFGEIQPPQFSSEDEREVQAQAVSEMVTEILAVDSEANIIVAGDMNDFQFSSSMEILEEAGLTSLTTSLLEENEQYSYIYNGNSQQLDHIYVSSAMLEGAQVDIVHRYSEFDSDSRCTDHDPVNAVLTCGEKDETSSVGSLFFSEYSEGSSNNKYLEIYNGSSETVSLADYTIYRYNNGYTDASGTYSLGDATSVTELAPGEMYIVANSSADDTILEQGDTALTGATWYNGDDCLQLVDGDGTVVDQIGILGEDPGSGWTVAGTEEGTKEHTLVRKSTVTSGNEGDWESSAGTSEDDSEWIVYDQDYWDNLGIHSIE
ncbi:MAG: lamin tail domain-containing protein [Spirochaetales bacterium]|nr:lamin tail domain-containing protein [Spirochaetales bacterium]